jgi:hypothetical protein
MSKLLNRQFFMTECLSKLLVFAHGRGFQLTLGEAMRSPEEAARLATLNKGIRNSAHTRRLAIDLNLFIDGQYKSDSEAHRPLGEFWEDLDLRCRWGGRFTRKDGNHYSVEFDGVS